MVEAGVDFHDGALALDYDVLAPLFGYCARTYGGTDGEDQWRALECILLLNGREYWAWNRRRDRLVAEGVAPGRAAAELRFTRVVQTRHPKAPEAWFHRRWVLQQLDDGDAALVGTLLREELQHCERCVTAHPRNYYAYAHRLQILRTRQGLRLVRADLDASLQLLPARPSDFSLVHHIFALLLCGTLQRGDNDQGAGAPYKDVLRGAMATLVNVAATGIQSYASHQSVWHLRRLLFTLRLPPTTAPREPWLAVVEAECCAMALPTLREIFPDAPKADELRIHTSRTVLQSPPVLAAQHLCYCTFRSHHGTAHDPPFRRVLADLWPPDGASRHGYPSVPLHELCNRAIQTTCYNELGHLLPPLRA
eukprot:CAMPEP_0119139982 /NCGR_PEP_ID=MMETSP1310-20130426/28462_1 /TAXON_ID=464262 /ORGANISM="Genus nov. species nov., Strain RCC2339" /LENGTH=364 /DNA_ID=CAMNT_0007131309 /DNA_START=162 /DNA_END=1252 /DNA_ORIENTATION=+